MMDVDEESELSSTECTIYRVYAMDTAPPPPREREMMMITRMTKKGRGKGDLCALSCSGGGDMRDRTLLENDIARPDGTRVKSSIQFW